jgi:hypothetical protein
MKFILSFCLSLILLVSNFGANSQEPLPAPKPNSNIEVVFTTSTGFTELVMIREHFAKKGIIINYKKIEYNKEGALKSLNFSVDCQDGISGSASTDNLNNKNKFGFYRNYSKDSASPFGTGNL